MTNTAQQLLRKHLLWVSCSLLKGNFRPKNTSLQGIIPGTGVYPNITDTQQHLEEQSVTAYHTVTVHSKSLKAARH